MSEPYAPGSDTRFYTPASGQPARMQSRDELFRSNSRDSAGPNEGDSRRGSQVPLIPKDGEAEQAEGQRNSKQIDKIKATQQQINLATEQLAKNIEMISERGERLEDLRDKSDQLGIQSQGFRTQANRVRRKMWWQNAKWTICLGVLVLIIVAGAVGGGIKGKEYVQDHHDDKPQTQTQSSTSASATSSSA